MSNSRTRRLWIVAIAFWVWFVASIFLQRYYPWVDAVFLYFWLFIVVVAGFYSVREMFRRAERTGEYVYFRGVPRCLRWIFESDEPPQSQSKPPGRGQ
jgi:hypothetical protein